MKYAQVDELKRNLIDVQHSVNDLLENLKDSRLLIFGGTGFVGRWICLVGQGILASTGVGPRLTIISRDKLRAARVLRAFIPSDISLPQIISYEEFFDDSNFKAGAEKVDGIFYAATPTNKDDKSIFRLPKLTERILARCADLNKPKFLHLSSGGVYERGMFHGQHISERMPRVELIESLNAYQAVKIELELLVEQADAAGIINGVNPRLFTFAGPGFPLGSKYASADFIKSAILNKRIVIKGHPETRRSYMHPADMVVWILRAWANVDVLKGRSFHIGSPVPLSLHELADRIAYFVGSTEIIMNSDPLVEEEWYVPEPLALRSLGCTFLHPNIDVIVESWLRYLSPLRYA